MNGGLRPLTPIQKNKQFILQNFMKMNNLPHNKNAQLNPSPFPMNNISNIKMLNNKINYNMMNNNKINYNMMNNNMMNNNMMNNNMMNNNMMNNNMMNNNMMNNNMMNNNMMNNNMMNNNLMNNNMMNNYLNRNVSNNNLMNNNINNPMMNKMNMNMNNNNINNMNINAMKNNVNYMNNMNYMNNINNNNMVSTPKNNQFSIMNMKNLNIMNMNNNNPLISNINMNKMNMNKMNNLNFGINMNIINNNDLNFNLLNGGNYFNLLKKMNNLNIKEPSEPDPEKEITMIFRYVNGFESNVKGRLKEKFSVVFERYLNNECPKTLRGNSHKIIHNANPIKYNLSLLENQIKDGDPILIHIIQDKNKINEKKEDKEKKVKKGMIKFEIPIKLPMHPKFLVNKEQSNDSENSKKCEIQKELINKKIIDHTLGTKTKEHEHILVYTLTRFSWKCNICNKGYPNNIGRNYCSVCSYNMCDKCRDNNNYIKYKPFSNDTVINNPSSHNTILIADHKHKLKCCITKRSPGFTGWICDKCKKNFDQIDWSYYCTLCDYDLCYECSKK